MYGDGLGSAGGDGLQILPAQHRAHAGTPGGPLITDNAGILDQILSGRADAELAKAFGAHQGCQRFLTFLHFHTPQIIRVVEPEFPVFDFQPAVAPAFAFQNQSIEAGLFQMEAKAAATVGRGKNARLRRQGRNIKPGRAGSAGARQGAGGNDHPVFLGEGDLLAGQVVAQNPGSHDFTAQVKRPLFVGPGVFPDRFGGQVHLHDFSHIAGIFGFHPHPSLLLNYTQNRQRNQPLSAFLRAYGPVIDRRIPGTVWSPAGQVGRGPVP